MGVATSEMTRSRRLPLNAVRVFEAVGRHLSFARAANELCVTQGAVSQQIKLLEDLVGVQLFKRGPGGVTLTCRGRSYFVPIGNAIQIIAEATDALCGESQRQMLRISSQPTFASRWLVPRMSKFNELHPDIVLAVGGGAPQYDFAESDADVAIRFGLDFPDVRSHLLFQPEVVPVCGPEMAKFLKMPEDLRRFPLLRSKYVPDEWRLWLDKKELTDLDHRLGPIFDSNLLAVEASRVGVGVALAHLPLVIEELKRGELIAPFEGFLLPNGAWHLLYPTSAQSVPKIVAFRKWILAEVTESQQGDAIPPSR